MHRIAVLDRVGIMALDDTTSVLSALIEIDGRHHLDVEVIVQRGREPLMMLESANELQDLMQITDCQTLCELRVSIAREVRDAAGEIGSPV